MTPHSHTWSLRGWILALIVLTSLCACRSQHDNGIGFTATHPLPDSVQQTFDRIFLEAVCQKQAGNADAQYDLLSEALRIHPDAPEALCEMGQLLMQYPTLSPDTTENTGLHLIERAYALDSTYREYAIPMASAYYLSGDTERAARIYRRLLQERYSEDYFSVLLYIYYIDENIDSLCSLLDLQDRHEGGPTEESINRRFLFLTRSADSTKVVRMGKEFFLRDTTSREALSAYTRFVYERQTDPSVALHHTRRMLRTTPRDPALRQGLLNCYQILPEHTAEYRALLDTLMLDPAFPTDQKAEIAYFSQEKPGIVRVESEHVITLMEQALDEPQDGPMLWRCYLDMKGDDIAPDTYYRAQLQILSFEPENTELRMKCLQSSLMHEDMDTSLDICRGGITQAPEYLVFSYYAALVLYTQGDKEQAIRTLNEGLTQAHENTNPDLLSESYAILGDLYHETGNDEACFAAYRQCLAHNPSNYGCLNNYAYYLSLKNRDLDRAEEMGHRAIEGEPGNATYLDTYAWILYQKKQYTQARIYIDQALDILGTDNTSAAIYDHAGDIYFRNGQTARAVEFWQKALQYSDDEAEQAALQRKVTRRRL